MQFTQEQILALAPDESSAKAAKGLLAPAKWPLLGQSEAALWGECQGSGSKPYQTQIDLAGPAFRCSCPSRKFPCKHGLALFLLRAQGSATFATQEPPAWVSEWLAGRQDKAVKQQAKAEAQAAGETQPADPEAAARREAKRAARMSAGVNELARWLEDSLRAGLASLEAQGPGVWQTLAARMVDAQLPGLALRLKQLAEKVGQGPAWPQQVLAGLGQLQLLVEASQRLPALSPAEQADVHWALGLSLNKDEVLSTGEKQQDEWLIIAQRLLQREGLWERRVWLQGRASGRLALIQDYAHGSTPHFAESWSTGMRQSLQLVFYPGACPLRALPDPTVARGPGQRARPDFPALAQALDEQARRLAANPWFWPQPLGLSGLTPLLQDGAWWLASPEGQALPLRLSRLQAWRLLAQSGGSSVQLFGEWDGEVLHPLSAWGDELLWWREVFSE